MIIKSNILKKIGNCSTEKSQAGQIYDSRYLGQTLCACTHGYAIGYIFVKDNSNDKK